MVLCQLALHYVLTSEEAARQFLEQLVALLTPGGRFIATVPSCEVLADFYERAAFTAGSSCERRLAHGIFEVEGCDFDGFPCVLVGVPCVFDGISMDLRGISIGLGRISCRFALRERLGKSCKLKGSSWSWMRSSCAAGGCLTSSP